MMRHLLPRQFFRIVLFASILGLAVGLAETAAEILFGAVVYSAWVPEDFRFSAATKIFYIIFNTSLYVLFFQLAGAIGLGAWIVARRGGASGGFSQSEAFPLWVVFYVVLGVVLFAGTSDIFQGDIALVPTVAISMAQVVFIGLAFLQVRAFVRKDSGTDSADGPDALRENEARVAAYILLTMATLFPPEFSEAFASPLARFAPLFVVLILVYPLSRLLNVGLKAIRGRRSGKETSRGPAWAAAILAVVIPLCVVVALGRRSIEDRSPPLSAETPERGPAGSEADGPNVIILLIDKLRADHVGCYGYHLETTPNIDEYANRGVRFENVRAQASWTLPSTVSLFSGLHPSTHGVRTREHSLSDRVDTMAEIFGDGGYATAAIVANPFLKTTFNVQQGFQHYFDDFIKETHWGSAKRNVRMLTELMDGVEALKLLYSRPEYKVPEHLVGHYNVGKMGIGTVNSEALRWVRKNRDRPFFLYLHYIDVHGPYVPPRPFDNEFSGTRAQEVVNLYDGALRYTDSQIDSFLEDLKQLGVFENSIIMITSDHGEEFQDHGGSTHGKTLYEEQLRVPLIILRTEAFPFNKTVAEPVGLIDILPTLVDYIKFEPANDSKDGKSFVDLLDADGRPDATEYQYAETELDELHRSVVRGNRWKLIYSEHEDSPLEMLFDLSRDPSEQVNLLRDRPEIASELRDRLAEAFSDFEARSFDAKTAQTSEQTRKLLESLGYLE